MGSSTPPQAQIYGSPVTATTTPVGGAGAGGGGISGSGLFFGAPGQGYGPMGTPSAGGKNAPPAQNQIPTGNQAALTPNYDPTLGMNGVYSMQNQAPGSYFTQGQDVQPYVGPATVQNGQPLASQISPLSIGDLGATQGYATAQSPLGMSNFNQYGPFASALMNGGKGYA